MKFYLGAHHPNWLATAGVPLFVSHRRLLGRKTFPRAAAAWALDSGGFTELSMNGTWETTEQQYVDAVYRYRDAIGEPDIVSPQDWMCEPWIVEKTGRSVEEHQKLTTENILHLRQLAPDLPFIPVLQGWTLSDYERHVGMYRDAGVDLTAERVVGLGSVCRRQRTGEIEDIVLMTRNAGIRPHGYGVKVGGLRRYGYLLTSADSMAWSYSGRRQGRCSLKSRCANHLHYALEWRERVLTSMDYQQQHLGRGA